MNERSAWKGIVAGAVAGLAATYAMSKFQGSFAKLAQEDQGNQSDQTGEPSTVKVADRAAVAATGRHLPDEQKEKAGNLVHYGFGTLMGALYGVAAEYVPAARTGLGSAFGSALFVGADEIGVPLAGLSKPPQETPAKLHLYAWAAHLVYGTALEGTRLATRKALDLIPENSADRYEYDSNSGYDSDSDGGTLQERIRRRRSA
jgi:putative membrane protein